MPPKGTKVYNKLVRDRIPEIIEAAGKKCTYEILSTEQYVAMLDAKLNEELAEYQKSKSLEELAEHIRYIHAFLKQCGLEINPDKEGLSFVYEYEPAFGRASELNGSPLTVTYTYSLYDCNQAVSKLITSINYGANSGPIDLLSWTPAKEALKKDGRYAIKASVVEDYWTPVYSYLAETDASYYAKKTFIVTHSDQKAVYYSFITTQ